MTSQLDIDPESPWVAEAEEIAASARHYNELTITLGLAFRKAQEEAYEGFIALGSGDEDTHPETTVERGPKASPLENFIEAVKQRIEIIFKGFAPEPLAQGAAAGVQTVFPKEQRLPAEWFGGCSVVLYFRRDQSSAWYVSQKGATQTLLLQFWSDQHQPLGAPLRVGETRARLPLNLENLATIELSIEGNDEPQH